MELIVALLYMLAYIIPMIISGVMICALLLLLFFIFSRFVPSRLPARKKIIQIGFILGLLAGIVGAIPAYLYLIVLITKVSSHEDKLMEPWRIEMLRDGRDKAWPAGTLTELQSWVDRNGRAFAEAMRLEIANKAANQIDSNHIETNNSDVVFIEQLANHPPLVDGYSDQTIASAIAFVHLSRYGFGDVGHPERFRRAPGHHVFANQMDYATYLKIAMTRCIQKPDSSECREVFTASVVNDFETKEDGLHPLNWYEKQQVLPILRTALGYASRAADK